MRVDKYFELVFCWKDIGLLNYFIVLELNICKL